MYALQNIKVLDLSSYIAGPYCGSLLADLGADVIKVEPPLGDRLRTYPPFANDKEDVEHGIYNLHFDAGKRSIALD